MLLAYKTFVIRNRILCVSARLRLGRLGTEGATKSLPTGIDPDTIQVSLVAFLKCERGMEALSEDLSLLNDVVFNLGTAKHTEGDPGKTVEAFGLLIQGLPCESRQNANRVFLLRCRCTIVSAY